MRNAIHWTGDVDRAIVEDSRAKEFKASETNEAVGAKSYRRFEVLPRKFPRGIIGPAPSNILAHESVLRKHSAPKYSS